jgi:integrase
MALEFEAIRKRSKFTGPDDPVFASKTGRPMDEHNTAKRTLKKIGAKLGMPWLSWHAFRRTHTTLADQLEMTAGDRMAMMGHADFRMTTQYTQVDMKRRREVIERMAEKLLKKPELREMKPVSEAAQ